VTATRFVVKRNWPELFHLPHVCVHVCVDYYLQNALKAIVDILKVDQKFIASGADVEAAKKTLYKRFRTTKDQIKAAKRSGGQEKTNLNQSQRRKARFQRHCEWRRKELDEAKSAHRTEVEQAQLSAVLDLDHGLVSSDFSTEEPAEEDGLPKKKYVTRNNEFRTELASKFLTELAERVSKTHPQAHHGEDRHRDGGLRTQVQPDRARRMLEKKELVWAIDRQKLIDSIDWGPEKAPTAEDLALLPPELTDEQLGLYSVSPKNAVVGSNCGGEREFELRARTRSHSLLCLVCQDHLPASSLTPVTSTRVPDLLSKRFASTAGLEPPKVSSSRSSSTASSLTGQPSAAVQYSGHNLTDTRKFFRTSSTTAASTAAASSASASSAASASASLEPDYDYDPTRLPVWPKEFALDGEVLFTIAYLDGKQVPAVIHHRRDQREIAGKLMNAWVKITLTAGGHLVCVCTPDMPARSALRMLCFPLEDFTLFPCSELGLTLPSSIDAKSAVSATMRASRRTRASFSSSDGLFFFSVAAAAPPHKV
jgi:hypothetical protein